MRPPTTFISRPLTRQLAPLILRPLSTSPPSWLPPKPSPKGKFITDRPVKIDRKPVFPAPHNPFEPAEQKPVTYNRLFLKVLFGLNRLLGYNGRRRTSHRESGRMMAGIVEAVERDKPFWYGECNLPKTFHSFFSIHLVYVLITLVRLRALQNQIPNPLSPIPQPRLPGPPGITPPARPPSIRERVEDVMSRPHEFKYRELLLTHFFNIVENEIRLMLGAEISRESAIKSRMQDYAGWWRASSLELDYVLGLTASENPADRGVADAELASWVWRLIFGRRGEGPKGEGELVYPEGASLDAEKEVVMAEQIELIVRFIRREMARLAHIEDRDIIAGNVGSFGKVAK